MVQRTGIDRRDVALAAVLVVIGQIDVLVAPTVFGTNLVGSPWVVSITYAVAGAAVAWRRTRPGTAFAVGIGALIIQAVAVGTSEGNGSLLPGWILSYSVAAHGTRRTAIAGLCGVVVAAGVREVFNPDNTSVAEVVDGLGWDLTVVAAWLLGAWVRTRRQLVAELRQRAVDSAEAAAVAERARVARELHDVLAHSLGVVVVQAEAAEEAMARRPDVAAESMRAIQRTGREALVEVRRLVGVLREDEARRDPAPGADAVEGLVRRMNEAGLAVELEVRGQPGSLPAAPDLAVYRIVQESLTNILKHAGATSASVRIEHHPDSVSIDVVDNGLGVDTDLPHGSGSGLRGMRERVLALGGSFAAGRTDSGGFAVHAVLQLEEPL